ncbi:MAG: PQQ-binding-like beta-propeller repeat protein [Candidatus Obscuribacter phosphatis]|uniref:PQQ-binding-like beta-propeller repeat protein n=1 Tax=Candidatus Obscuribacter phosphatis TaxID=1906157 RepID=A0A8J7PF82_9BACT|nr:PQQ-binding-like beta-propeller repeat protein [Candidatus Obscuribacter phosphatis]
MTSLPKPARQANLACKAFSIAICLAVSSQNLMPAMAQAKPQAKPVTKKAVDRSSAPAKKENSVAGGGQLTKTGNQPGQSISETDKAQQAQHAVALPAAEAAKATQGLTSQYRGGWQMFLHNPSRTGNSYIDIPPANQGSIKWKFPAEGPIDSSPAIYKGVIYFGSDDGHVYAVDEQNGRLLWKSKLGDKVKSSPAISDGVLVVGCEDKKVYGLNNRDGKILWSFETKDRVSSSPAVHEAVAYVGSWDGHLYAIDAKTGQLRWQFPQSESPSNPETNPDTNLLNGAAPNSTSTAAPKAADTAGIPQSSLGRITSSPCLAPGVVICSAHNGYVYALSTQTGKLVWQFRTGAKLMASPMVLDHTVYFGSWDHAFYAVDLASGKQKWKTGAAESFSVTATGVGGKIFAANDDLKLYCLDAHSGKVLWKTQINSPVPLLSSAPAIAGNMLYCGSPDANVYAIDTRNGAIKWKLKTQRPIVCSPALTTGGVCIGSQDGNLYLIN